MHAKKENNIANSEIISINSGRLYNGLFSNIYIYIFIFNIAL